MAALRGSSTPSPRFRVSTALKTYVLRRKEYSLTIKDCGFDHLTDPEIIAEGLRAYLPLSRFQTLLDEAVGHNPSQRMMAKDVFGV
jgi:O-methyltransferase involved in polyketide biosynthesis